VIVTALRAAAKAMPTQRAAEAPPKLAG
jgi:hypothetical protein